MPKHLRDELEQQRRIWLRLHPQPWAPELEREFHRRFTGAIERWLDARHGSCVLRRPACAQVVADVLRHFDGQRCAQIAWVVMPNHVHLLLVQRAEWPLEVLLHSWKRFSSRRINQILGSSGSFWQRDYFDRLVRDEKHFANCVRYIRHNPKKASLVAGQYVLFESELARKIE